MDTTADRCDKCGEEVSDGNNLCVIVGIATAFKDGIRSDQMIRRVINEIRMQRPARHFLPVPAAEGRKPCEGSPSRAQHIEGQPPDPRGFPYESESEPYYRAAYIKAQEMYPPNQP